MFLLLYFEFFIRFYVMLFRGVLFYGLFGIGKMFFVRVFVNFVGYGGCKISFYM